MRKNKKSSVLMTALALTLSPSLLFADPPSRIGYIDATIGVKNSTNDTISVACKIGTTDQGDYALGGAQTIKKGGAYTFQGKAGDGCSVAAQGPLTTNDTNIVCDYTDTTTGNTGTFTLGACQNYTPAKFFDPDSGTCTNNISVDQYGEPPTPYYCTKSSADYSTKTESVTCSSNEPSASTSTCKVEAYFAVVAEEVTGKTYHFTWDNIKLPSAQGQRLTTTLAHDLEKSGDYGKVTGSYNQAKQQISITLPPPGETQANPYDGLTSVSQCRNACVPS